MKYTHENIRPYQSKNTKEIKYIITLLTLGTIIICFSFVYIIIFGGSK